MRRIRSRGSGLVVVACLKAIDDVASIGFGGHRHDGYEGKSGIRLEFLQNRDAIELRHHYVEKHEIWLEFPGRRLR